VFHEFPTRVARFKLLFEALRRVYAERPLVVWLEDGHRSADALQFLRYGLERARAEPLRVMAVVTVRDDLLVESRDASGLLRELCDDAAAECVRVEPLGDADSRRLVSSLLHLEGDLAERIATRSGGNPLYATQLVGDWVNRGVLEAGRRGFVLSGSVQPDVPGDVHAVWMQRLDRVLDESAAAAGRTRTSAAERTQMLVLLELAAALGGSVDMAEWMSVCSLAGVPDPSPVLEPLLASRMAQVGTDSWSFSHSMLRDSLERIARERNRWAAHNRMCADMLEQRRPVPHWGDSERIGRHRFEAAQFDTALSPLVRGARERTRLEEYPAALELLALCDRALDQLDRAEHDARRLEGWLLRADIHLTRRELDEAEELANRVRARAADADGERFGGEALLVLARVHQHKGRIRIALDEFRGAQDALRITGPKHRLAACLSEQAHAMLTMNLLDQAWEAFNEAQEIYEDVGQFVAWAENQLGLARVSLRQGEVVHATTLCRRVRTFGRREQLNRIEAAACEVLAEVQTEEGQLTDAMRSLATSIELFEDLGLVRQALHARSLKILLLLESGAEGDARFELEQLGRRSEVDVPRVSRVLMRCLELALALGGSAGDLEARFNQTAALLTGMEVPTPEVVRCLQLASKRAREKGIPEWAERIERFEGAISTGGRDSGLAAIILHEFLPNRSRQHAHQALHRLSLDDDGLQQRFDRFQACHRSLVQVDLLHCP
jgi:tetratricopeptide (TPR) repeat protein